MGEPSFPDLTGDTLAGGEDNKVMFFKSRGGHLLCLDDSGCTVRIQDTSGNSNISLEGSEIKISQKSGDINVHAEKEIRFDCKKLKVKASGNITFCAGTSVSITVGGKMKVKASKDINVIAKKDIKVHSKANIEGKAAGEVTYTGTKQVSVVTQAQSISFAAGGKLAVSGKSEVGVVGGVGVNFQGLKKCSFTTNGTLTLKASGVLTGMSNAININ